MKKIITPSELYDAIAVPGWNTEKAIETLRIHQRTWQRWMSGETPIPYCAYQLLYVLASGYIPSAGKRWEGWRFLREKLWSPEGWDFDPIDLHHLAWIRLNNPDIFYAYVDNRQSETRDYNVLPFPNPELIRKRK